MGELSISIRPLCIPQDILSRIKKKRYNLEVFIFIKKNAKIYANYEIFAA